MWIEGRQHAIDRCVLDLREVGASVHVGIDEMEDFFQLVEQAPRCVDVGGVEHLALIVNDDGEFVVFDVWFNQHFGNVELHRVEGLVQHLLGIDAAGIDVSILDAHQRHAEDLQRAEIMARCDDLARCGADFPAIELKRHQAFRRTARDSQK